MAAKFHEVLLGRGKSTLLSRQQTRSHALADIQQVRKFTKAAGAELSRTYMVLEGVALRFAAQIARVDLGASQGHVAVRDLERVGKLLELVVKCQKEARLCLSSAAVLSQDLRAFGFIGEAVGGSPHSGE